MLFQDKRAYVGVKESWVGDSLTARLLLTWGFFKYCHYSVPSKKAPTKLDVLSRQIYESVRLQISLAARDVQNHRG